MAPTHQNQQLEPRRDRKRRQPTHHSSSDTIKYQRPKKRRRATKASEEFYSVRSIIGENTDKYLIDWEDDPVTGKSYSPTWEPKANANQAAVKASEDSKKGQGSELHHPNEEATPIVPSQESDSITPASRKRPLEDNTGSEKSSALSEPKTKHPKLGVSHHKSAGHSLSNTKGSGKYEIEDSLEREAGINRNQTGADIQVAISIHSSFDNSAYLSATVESTQQSNSAGSQIHVHTLLDIRGTHGQNSAEAVIPDSQESQTLKSSKNPLNNQNNNSTQPSDHGTQGDKSQNSFPIVRPSSTTNKSSFQGSEHFHQLSHSHPETSTESEKVHRVITDSESHISWLTAKPFSNSPSTTKSRQQQHQQKIATPKGTQISESLASTIGSQSRLSAQQHISHEHETIVTSPSHFHQSQISRSRNSNISLPETALQTQESPFNENSRGQLALSPIVASQDNNWQAAPTISTIDPQSPLHSSSDIFSFIIFPDNSDSPIQESRRGSIDQSILSQQDGNSAGSFREPEDKSQDSIHRSQRSVTSGSILTEGIRIPTTGTANSLSVETANLDSFLPGHLIPSSGLPEFPDSYGSNIPQRPDPLSSSNMSNGQDAMELESNASGTPGFVSVREMMRQRRAKSASTAPLAVTRASSGTPAASSPGVPSITPLSAIPAMGSTAAFPSRSPSLTPARVSSPQLPTTPIPADAADEKVLRPSQMLPNRVVTVPTPSLPINPRAVNSTAGKKESGRGAMNTSKSSKLGATEYIVPLPMMSNVRKIYEATIRNHKREIQEFTTTNIETSDPQVVEKIEKMIDTLKRLGDHQDIDTEMAPSQANLGDDITKKWAETCSTKCAFVRELLDALRPSKLNVTILARPGRMLDILEAIFRSQKYVYSRPDQQTSSVQSATGSLRVTLLPSGEEGEQYITTRADVVIAFDETCKLGELQSYTLRSGFSTNKFCPLINLVVANSAEHIELCLAQASGKSRERTRALVNATVEARHEVGKLDAGDYQPDQAAVLVAQFINTLLSGGSPRWPLTMIENIRGLSNLRFRPDSALPSSPPTSSYMQLPQAPRSSAKRSRTGSDSHDHENSKRARSTPIPGETNTGSEASQTSDSMRGPVPIHVASGGAVKSEYQDLVDQNTALLAQVAALSSKVSDLESQLLTKQSEIANLYKFVKDRDHSISVNIAPKYQEAIKESADARHNLKQVTERNESLVKRGEQRDAEIQKLKEEKSTIQEELNAARAALSSSSIPEVAALAQKDEEIRLLKESLTTQEKKTASAEKLSEFIKEQYQTASTAAAEISAELSSKDDIISDLTRKADENIAICARAQAQSEKEESDKRIEELEALLQDRDDELVRKRDEARVRGSRRETRGGSVPRSPAPGSLSVGGTASPRVIGGSRSRGGSPAVGELGGREELATGFAGASSRRIRQILSD